MTFFLCHEEIACLRVKMIFLFALANYSKRKMSLLSSYKGDKGEKENTRPTVFFFNARHLEPVAGG